MMIHAELRWSDDSNNILWTISMAHAVHLYSNTHYISSGMSTEEFWTSYKSSHSSLHNTHQWGCPAYDLEPILQDGNTLPKWMKRYRRVQYL